MPGNNKRIIRTVASAEEVLCSSSFFDSYYQIHSTYLCSHGPIFSGCTNAPTTSRLRAGGNGWAARKRTRYDQSRAPQRMRWSPAGTRYHSKHTTGALGRAVLSGDGAIGEHLWAQPWTLKLGLESPSIIVVVRQQGIGGNLKNPLAFVLSEGSIDYGLSFLAKLDEKKSLGVGGWADERMVAL
jgi:hypothetical protein